MKCRACGKESRVVKVTWEYQPSDKKDRTPVTQDVLLACGHNNTVLKAGITSEKI